MTDCSLADITLVINRSGSMSAIREEAESGINALLREQAAERGRANLTLVQFDTEYEFIHRGVPIGDVPPYTLEPRGMTALLDAVGRAINEVGSRLAALPEEARPGLVVFAIITDGHENSSREFTKPKIREMIAHQRHVYNWQFVFLGADDGAFDEASALGIDAAAVAQYDRGRVADSYRAMSRGVGRVRGRAAARLPADLVFTDEEREQMREASPADR